MSNWKDACAVDDIESEDVIRVDIDGRAVAVYRTEDDQYFASDAYCTHERELLTDGLLIDYVIECPKHNGRFDIREGKPLGSPVCVALETFEVNVKDGRVFVQLPE